MATLDFGSGSARDVLSGTVSFLSSGGTIGRLLQGSILGIATSFALGGIRLVNAIFDLIVNPIVKMGQVAVAFLSATLLEPLGIVEAGALSSATAVQDQFGLLAFPVGIAILLGGLWIVLQFLQEDETPDFIAIPGFPDIPDLPVIGNIGVEEEAEPDE